MEITYNKDLLKTGENERYKFWNFCVDYKYLQNLDKKLNDNFY